MLQIETFRLPEEQDKANEFLRSHAPAGEISFNNSLVFIGYDDGVYAPHATLVELVELLQAAKSARLQQEVALQVLQYELADLKPGKQIYDQVNTSINDVKAKMDIQDVKIAFLEKRITELQSGNGSQAQAE